MGEESLTPAERIRDRARTVAEAYSVEYARGQAPGASIERTRLRGRVEGLLIAARTVEGTAYTPRDIVAEARAYIHAAAVRPRPGHGRELTHAEIMDAYRSGFYD